jgi:hypothetical protein
MSTDDLGDVPKLMVLSPFGSWFEAESTVPGSYTFKADCGHLSWISPQGSTFLNTHADTITVCLNCQPFNPDPAHQKFAVPGARKALDDLFEDSQWAENYASFVKEHDIKEWPA